MQELKKQKETVGTSSYKVKYTSQFKKDPTMLYFHTHQVHLCKSTIPGEKKKGKKNHCLFHAELDAEAEWIRKLCEGIISRTFSRQGTGSFSTKLPFFFSSPCLAYRYANCRLLYYRNVKDFFLLFKEKQITKRYHWTHQPCIVYLSNLLCQWYWKVMDVLQCSLRICPVCKENITFWPQH